MSRDGSAVPCQCRARVPSGPQSERGSPLFCWHPAASAVTAALVHVCGKKTCKLDLWLVGYIACVVESRSFAVCSQNKTSCCVTPQLFIFHRIYVCFFLRSKNMFPNEMILLQFHPSFFPPPAFFFPTFRCVALNKGLTRDLRALLFLSSA